MAKATLLGDQKQEQLGLGFGSAERPEKTTTGEFEDSSITIVELKKRKRIEDKNPILDTAPIDDGDDSGNRLAIKKSKRVQRDDIKSAEFRSDIKSSDEGSSLKRERSSDLGSSLNREEKGKEFSDLGSNLKRGRSSDLGSSLNREKGKECTLGSEQNESSESGKYSGLGTEFEEVLRQVGGKYLDSGMMEKKKRKRDEIEAEYEERRSRAMGMNGGGEGVWRGGRVVGEKRKHIDDPVDIMMMVSKDDDGFDDEAILLRTVCVGNLPLKVKKKALVEEFSRFGEIESVRIQSVPLLDTKIPRKGALIQKETSDAVDSVHAYIVFKTEEAAQASLANDMALVGGNHVHVDRACPPRKKLKGGDAPLYDNKRTVFVGNLPFDVKDGENLVLKKRRLKLRDRELRLDHARSNLTPSKRKNSSSGEREDSSTKKLAVDLRTPYNSNKVKMKSGSSYQCLQASTSGASEQAGRKRKLESQTPESYWSYKNRKLR